jgi:hypothetical protein
MASPSDSCMPEELGTAPIGTALYDRCWGFVQSQVIGKFLKKLWAHNQQNTWFVSDLVGTTHSYFHALALPLVWVHDNVTPHLRPKSLHDKSGVISFDHRTTRVFGRVGLLALVSESRLGISRMLRDMKTKMNWAIGTFQALSIFSELKAVLWR